MNQNYCSTAVAVPFVRKNNVGRILSIVLLGFLFLFLCVTRSFGQKVQKGRESKKGEMNFSEVAKHFKEHPQKIKRMKLENEEDEEKRPDPQPVSDPSLIRKRAGHQGRNQQQQPISVPGTSIPSGSMPVSNAPTALFESTLDNNSTIPPDTHGAVDSNYCVTTLNSTVKIQTRAGAAVSSVTLNQFFLPVLPGGGAFDPRAHYDPYANRWFIVAVSGANSASSSVLIAVSKTSNPTSGWWMYKVIAMPAGTHWLDYPNVGLNKKWLVVTGNLFGSSYGGAKVFMFNKQDLMSGAGATYSAVTQTSSFTICPAITYDNTLENMFAVESWNGGSGVMRLWKISGAVGSETMTTVSYPANTDRWRNAGGSSSTVDFAPQAGISNKIQTNDDRVTQMVFMNNKLWFAHTVFLPYNISAYATRSAVQWWQTDTTGTPLQIGRVDDSVAGRFYAFPSIAVNTSDDAAIGFSLFSSSMYPSAGYTLRMHTDAVDSMRPVQVYKPGGNSYYKTYGGSRNRWGDYSSTCLDPINMKDFWTIQEAASATANVWDTWWANIVPDGCAVGAISGSSALCVGNTTTLTDATSGGTWSSSNTAVATVNSAGVVSSVSPGTATIAYAALGCSATKTITVNAAPGAISGAATVCAGATTTMTNSSTGGTWSSSNASVASVNATTGVVTGAAAGVATITYSTGTGCSATKAITVNAVPAAISGTSAMCSGTTAAMTSTTSGGAWSSSNTAVATISSTGVVSAVATGTATITYAVSGCSATKVVTVNSAPAAISGGSSVCAGSTTAYTNATTGGTWSSSNTAVATVSTSGMVNGVTAGTATITYSTGSGCDATKVISVNAAPSAISGASVVCAGTTTAMTNTTSGGVWSSSNTAVASISSVGVVTAVSAGTATITYSVGGCMATKAITVNTAPAVISGSSSVCTGATTALTNTSTGGTWSSSNTSVATVNASTGVVNGVAAGVVNITYSTGTGCDATKTITVNASPATIGGTTTVCTGSTTALTNSVTGGTWSSSNTAVASVGMTTGAVAGVAAGTSVITYMTPGGCYATTVVTVNAAPSAGTLSGASSVTTGSTIALTSSAAGGVWSSSNTAIATVSSTGVVTGVAAGTVSITYGVSSSCGTAYAIKSITVTAPAATNATPVFTGGASQSMTMCKGAAAKSIISMLAVSDADAGQTETWSVVTAPAHGTLGGFNATAVSTGGTLTPSGLTYTPVSTYSGTDAFTVKVSDGIASATIVINVTISPTVTAGTISGPTTIGVSTPVTFAASGTPGGTWSSSNTALATVGATTGVVTGVASGYPVIQYTVSNSCGSSTAVLKIRVKANGKAKSPEQTTNDVQSTGVTVYPNPVRSAFTFVAPAPGKFYLFDTQGGMVAEYQVEEGNNALTMKGNLPPGIYIGKFMSKDGDSESIRIVYEP